MFTLVELSFCGRRFIVVPIFSPPKTFLCPVCGRECDADQGSRHHVLPKSQGGRAIEVLCRPCHRQIHNLFSVKELARDYDTVKKLRAAPEMQTWIRWVQKKSARRTPGILNP